MDGKELNRLQPIILVSDKRLDCGKCGALAIFMATDKIKEDEDGYQHFEFESFCQACWQIHVIDNEDETTDMIHVPVHWIEPEKEE